MPEELNITNEEIEKSSIKTLAFRWLANQGVVTVLLFCILGAIVAGGHHAITQVIPAHLKEIKSGYKEVSEEIAIHHKETVQTIERSREAERELVREILQIERKKPSKTSGESAGALAP